MTCITYAPIDRQFRILERDLPQGAPFNGIDPLEGITFGFALESRYPLAGGVPAVYYGTVDGEVDDQPEILLRSLTQADYDAAELAETAAREAAARVPTPAAVTMRQARLALLAAGILDDAQTAIDAMTGDEGRAARIEWEYATDLRRDHPLVVELGQQLGLDDALVDELFVQAAGID